MIPPDQMLVLEMNRRQADPVQKRSQRDSKRKCPTCSRTFSKTEHLERHVRSHTKEKPFQCQRCGRKYGRNDSLLRHFKDQHNGAWNDGVQDSGSTEVAPKPGQGMIDHAMSNQHMSSTSTHDATIEIPMLDDLGMSVATYHGPTHQSNSFQPTPGVPTWDSNAEIPSNVFSQSHQTSFATENWLSYGNLDDSLLRDWPFVIDHADLGCARVETTYTSGKPIADLQQSWHTHLERDEPVISGYTTPLPSQNQDVDDNYRQSLHRRLQIRVLDESLPSAEFLNLCVRAYFQRFHPVFPVVHAATFRPSKTNAVLLLSICSIGSLLTGHPGAVPRGIQLFERLNKAILSNWETLMRRGPDENFAMIQASLLGQTFGLLSGQAKHLAIVDTFHGTIVAWGRRAKLFHQQHHPSNYQDVDSRWREWARTEERIRLGMAIQVHEAEIASTLHHETLLSPNSRRAPSSDTDALFFASNPQDWIALYHERPTFLATPSSETSSRSAAADAPPERLLSIPINCHFSIYAALEDVLASILQARIDEALTNAFVQNMHLGLMAFRRQYGQQISPASKTELLQSGNTILWHFIWISLHADMDLLERSIGRDGPTLDPADLAKVHEWASSDSAQRAIAHAMMIKKSLEHFPLTSEPALHVPRSVFCSAICLFAYSKYGNGGDEQQPCDFPEFQQLNVNIALLLREAKGNKSRNDEQLGPMYGFVDLLQRIGHWEISRKFASILGALIHAESN